MQIINNKQGSLEALANEALKKLGQRHRAYVQYQSQYYKSKETGGCKQKMQNR
jgi:hypothetical protein